MLITHNMGVVADLADRVAVMYKGEIVEQADVTDAVRLAAARLHEAAAGRRAAPGQATPHPEAWPNGAPTRAAESVVAARTCGSSTRAGFGSPAFIAVDGVSFTIRPGEVLGLVGESG